MADCSDRHNTDAKVAWAEELTSCSKVRLMHHVTHSAYESVQLLTNAFETYKDVFPQLPKRHMLAPSFSTLLSHAVWTAFFDRCLIKLPTCEHVSPQYGGVWSLENSSLVHYPIIALNRTVRDGTSYASGLIPIPEEWLVERD